MATPKYFEYLPNIKYALSTNKAGITNDIQIKDYFKAMSLRPELFREETLYVEYIVKNGETPDQVSRQFYEDTQFYWIILQINGIYDYYNQWPLSSYELEQYITRKYGTEGAGGIHHYETQEVKDADGRIIQHAGLRVTENYVFRYVDSTDATVELTSTPNPISNRAYELLENDKKSQIQILDPRYILDYAREFRKWAQSQPDSSSSVDISDSFQY